MNRRPGVLELACVDRWTQEGDFPDADGQPVRAYDEVVLLRPTLPEKDGGAAYLVAAGTLGTVLSHCGDGEGVLQLEFDWHEAASVIGYAVPADVRLSRRNEEKYPR